MTTPKKNHKICTNCQGNHPAFSRSCVQYKKEQLIVKTQFKEGLSYRAAINKLKQTGEISIYSYKKALESNTLLTSTLKAPKLNTANRFSVLQVDESQSYGVAKQSNQKSPKRLSKRIRDNSSEEGEVSPKLNPKQRPKTKNQDKGNSLQKIVAEVHVGNGESMDDTIIFTEEGHKKLDIEARGTALQSEASLSTIVPSELDSPTVLPLELASPTVIPSECSSSAVVSSETSIPTVMSSERSVPTIVLSENITTNMLSKTPVPTIMPSESSITKFIPSEASIPTPSSASVLPVVAATPSASSQPDAVATPSSFHFFLSINYSDSYTY